MKSVLIVDDRKQDLYMLRVLLEGHGYTVVTASNGAEALKAARKTPPDIIISDIMMPVMDGFVLCREWMGDERLKNIPLVFYTATYTDAEDEEFALSFGAARFIVKPTEPDEFMKIIQGVVRDLEEGKIKPRTPTLETDKQALKLYDERLINKLERTTLKLEKEVAEHKLAEEALRQSEAHLRTLIETIPDLVWLKDPDGVYLFCNPRFERFFGATESEIVGKTDYDFVGKELADSFREKDKAAMAAAKPCVDEEEITYADDGHKESIETIKTLMYDSEGTLVGVLGIARDITERRRMEKELAEHREHLEERVRDRTEELRSMVMSMAGRENRMVELKEAIKKLRAQLEQAGITPVADDLPIEGRKVKSDEGS